MGLFTIKELPKGDPDVLFTIQDRSGLHNRPKPRPQTLALDYQPNRVRANRQALRALDMPLTPDQRERVYRTDSRSPRDSPRDTYVKEDGEVVRTESRSPNKKREKRLSLSLSSYSTSPRSPRQSPIVVQERSPRIMPHAATAARLPTPEPRELPQPDAVPFFVRAPTGEFYESDTEWSSSTDAGDEVASEDANGVKYNHRHRKPRTGRRAPPPAPEAPTASPIIINHGHRRGHSSHSHSHSPTVGWEHEHFDGDDGIDRDFERPIRRSHSHRDRSHSHRHHYHRRSHYHHTRHGSYESRDDGRPSRDHRGTRSRASTNASSPAGPEGRRETTYTYSRNVSRDAAGRHEKSKSEEKEIKGHLEDPREVRKREMVEEKEVFGDDGRRVKQYHYR